MPCRIGDITFYSVRLSLYWLWVCPSARECLWNRDLVQKNGGMYDTPWKTELKLSFHLCEPFFNFWPLYLIWRICMVRDMSSEPSRGFREKNLDISCLCLKKQRFSSPLFLQIVTIFSTNSNENSVFLKFFPFAWPPKTPFPSGLVRVGLLLMCMPYKQGRSP